MILHSISISSFLLNAEGKYEHTNHQQPISQASEMFISDLHSILNAKQNKTHMALSVEHGVVSKQVISFAKGDVEYNDAASLVTQNFEKLLSETALAEEGTVVIAHYEVLNSQYLYFAILEKAKYYTLDDKKALSQRDFLDSSKCLVLSRFDLTELSYQTTVKKSVTFSSKGVSTRYKNFFVELFSVEESDTSKRQSKNLMSAVMQFTQGDDGEIDDVERYELHKRALSHCEEVASENNGFVSASSLDEVLSPESNKFSEFYKTSFPEEDSDIAFNKRASKSLVEYRGQGGGITLSFDAKLLGNRVEYDPLTDTLSIKGVPPNLKDQLLKALNLKMTNHQPQNALQECN